MGGHCEKLATDNETRIHTSETKDASTSIEIMKAVATKMTYYNTPKDMVLVGTTSRLFRCVWHRASTRRNRTGSCLRPALFCCWLSTTLPVLVYRGVVPKRHILYRHTHTHTHTHTHINKYFRNGSTVLDRPKRFNAATCMSFALLFYIFCVVFLLSSSSRRNPLE